jgi:signal transduction histidine kinase
VLRVSSTTDCADHLLSLVNDILDFERIECNQLELEQIPFSIVTETRKVVDMARFPAGTPPTPHAHLDRPPHPNTCSLTPFPPSILFSPQKRSS